MALWRMAVAGRHAAAFDQPDDLQGERLELAAELFNSLAEWADIDDQLQPGDVLRAAEGLGEQLRALREHGMVVYAGRRERLLTGGVGAAQPWVEAHVHVLDAADPRVQRREDEDCGSEPSPSPPP